MWESLIEEIEPGKVKKYKIAKGKSTISFLDAILLLKTSLEFRQFFIELLKSSSYEGYFWEVKPITRKKLNKEFEFVLVNSSILPKIIADKSSFKDHFKSEQIVVSFANLSGDAKLIVPAEMSDKNNYSHLAGFVRKAPGKQVEKFWQVVGEEYDNLINDVPRWLSTAGLGVNWLHVRIDSTPKYYRYHPYKYLN